MRIIIVDEERDVAEALGLYLSASGHDIDVYFSLSHALQHIWAYKGNTDILFTGLSGNDNRHLEFISNIKRKYEHINVVLLLNKDTDEATLLKAYNKGASYCLFKPVNMRKLESTMNAISFSCLKEA